MSSLASTVGIYRYTVRRSAGIDGSGWTKAVVILTALVAFVPAIVAVGVPPLLERFAATATSPLAFDRIRVLAEDPSFVPSAAQYLFVISAVILVASAFTAADAVAGAGERGLLTVYRRVPVGAAGYLAAKWLAVATVLLVVTAGPLVLLLVGTALNGRAVEPAAAIRVALASAVVVAPYAAVSLLVASLWRSRAAAAGATLLALSGVSAVARFAAASGGTAWHLADVRHGPLELAARVLGASPSAGSPDTGILVASVLAMTLVPVALNAALQRRRHRSTT